MINTNIADYQIIETISTEKSANLIRCFSEKYGKRVIISILEQSFLTSEDLQTLYYHCEVIKRESFKGFLEILDYKKTYSEVIFTLSDFPSINLQEFCRQRKINSGQFLRIAVKIVDILIFLHNNNLLHKGLSTKSFLFAPDSEELKLAKFAGTSIPTFWIHNNFAQNIDRDILNYISPEQTGRLTLPVDFRSDLYSVGMIFYEIITGETAFSSLDPMEMIHFHLAKTAINPSLVNPEIPLAVSSIIMKLISKNPEERYNSSESLKKDLILLLEKNESLDNFSSFIPGKEIFSEKLEISGRFYGRKTELEKIKEAYDLCCQGRNELIFISGSSGIGKTTLVNEFEKELTFSKKLFVRGKFEKLKKDIPYSAIIQALQRMIMLILSEKKTVTDEIKKRINSLLGDNIPLIANILPEIYFLVENNNLRSEFDAKETENRFKIAFKKFIEVFATKEHPLVVFLDNIHFADSASLNFLNQIFSESGIGYFMLICSYIDEPTSKTEKFVKGFNSKNLPKNLDITNIKIFVLDQEKISLLLTDSFKSNKQQTEELSGLIQLKTGGNPFFVKEFIKSLYEKKLLYFEINKGWFWQIEEIKKLQITENVIELMTEKFFTFSSETQSLLKIAACIGNRFSFNLLVQISEKSEEQIYGQLNEAIKTGLIVTIADYYKFLHDKVQETIYTLIDEDERKKLHHKIGNILLNTINKQQSEELLFDMVKHFNESGEIINKTEEKNKLAELNLLAGKRAKHSAAYDLAISYFKKGKSLIQAKDWVEENHVLNFQLYFESAECHYLLSNFEEAENAFDFLLVNSSNNQERLKIFEQKIVLYTSMNSFQQALETGKQALELCQLNLPLDKLLVKAELAFELIKVRKNLSGLEPEYLLKMPLMKDEKQLNILKTLINLAPAAYIMNTELMVLLILKMISISLIYGNSNVSAFAYASYAMLMCSLFNDPEKGLRMGKVAIDLNEKFSDQELQSKINFIFYALIKHWSCFDRKDPDFLGENFKKAIQTGDLLYASYSLDNQLSKMFIYGENLEKIYTTAKNYHNFVINTKNQAIYANYFIRLQKILCFNGKTFDLTSLSDQNFDEKLFFAELKKNGRKTDLFYGYLSKIQLCYIFGQYQEALFYAEKIKPEIKISIGTLLFSEFYFYYCLSLLAVQRKNGLKTNLKVRFHLRKFKNWSEKSPEIFSHRYKIIKAELLSSSKRKKQTEKLFKEAIAEAEKNGFKQNQALGYELLANFYSLIDKKDKEEQAIVSAYNSYIEWGAKGKINQLLDKYHYLSEKNQRKIELNGNIFQKAKTDELFDLTSVMKSSQALSEEIIIESLIEKLLKIVLENAGAQRGLIILKNNDELIIVAEGMINDEHNKNFQPVKVERSEKVSRGIVYYVEKTLKDVVINDASEESLFSDDLYIKNHQPKSILCIPVTKQANLVGILYLENNLTEGAFTEKQIQVLKILTAQAAISLENARFYHEMKRLNLELENHKKNLENMVNERTRQLEETQKKMLDIAHSAGMAEISTGVLHNIGNLLNSVNISTQIINDTIAKSKIDGLFKANSLLNENMAKIEEFIIKNPKGKKLLNYYLSIGKLLNRERKNLQKELKEMTDKVLMIREVIYSQHDYAKTTFLYEKVFLEDIVEDSLYIKRKDLEKAGVKIEKIYLEIPQVAVQKTKLINVLLNLLKNAIEAMVDNEPDQKLIKISISCDHRYARISISDNGEGIPPENIFRIFKHGFSTKEQGYGFGLHFCANSLTEMNGKISAKSDGKGAEFILELPIEN